MHGFGMFETVVQVAVFSSFFKLHSIVKVVQDVRRAIKFLLGESYDLHDTHTGVNGVFFSVNGEMVNVVPTESLTYTLAVA